MNHRPLPESILQLNSSPSLPELNRYVRTPHEERMLASSVAANNYGCH
jgi:hypothetical protein